MGMHVPGERMELRTEVEIDASASAVWQALTDFSRYPEWNPFIASVEGDCAPGRRLKITLTLPGGQERTPRVMLLTFDPPHELRWRERVLFGVMLEWEHFFKLTESSNGRTRLMQGANYRGWAVRYMGSGFTAIARGFAGMNQALKRRVERKT